ASFAVLQYGALVVHPPTARLLAIAATATAGGAALTLSSRLPSRWLALAAALLAFVATLCLALIELGVPAHLLLPTRWATLAHDLRGGLRALEDWLWPYRGGREWARLAVLLPVPVALAGAPWIHYRSESAARETASFNWDQANGPIAWSRSTLTMFELQASRPQLLRVTALDRFDGQRFLRSSAPPGDARLDIPRAHERSWLSEATVRVGGLRSQLLVSDDGQHVAAWWIG